MSLLSVQDLSCERNGAALFENLDFSVNSGELLQIVGPNGSGKTTLLRILAGLSTLFSGRLAWHDSFLYLGHASGIKAMLTPLENLRWYAPDKSTEDILNALKQWHLHGYENQPCCQLSAGQQQRVALARLLLTDATVWLLDEPFTAIDQTGVSQLESLLIAHAECGGAVVLTSHHIFRQTDRLHFIPLQQVTA